MKMSDEGKTVLKHYESCHLEAYPDPASPLGKECQRRGFLNTDYRSLGNWSAFDGTPWTIGWGHTGDVKPGQTITQKEADALLDSDLQARETIVNSALTTRVSQGQFDALVSFVYNVGQGKKGVKDGLVVLKNGNPSSLLRLTNARDFDGGARQFGSWIKAGGVPLYGLVKRRAAEKALYQGETGNAAVKIGDSQPRP